MKHSIIKILPLCFGMLFVLNSCRDDLLDQPSTTEMPASAFWETVEDAEYALNGTVADIRYLFNKDYFLDAMGEYVHVSGSHMQGTANAENKTNSEKLKDGAAYDGFYELYPKGYGGQFTNMFRFCYGGVNRCNYVIEGIENMIEKESNANTIKQLEELLAETKLFRSLVYLRLISMWGDVPYMDERIYNKDDAYKLTRTPIKDIKDSLISDLTYAYEKLPEKASVQGRMSKPAALALRGKVQLYWASWNNFGWPELDTFTADQTEAQKAYKAAAEDFRKVIDDFGLALFRNGEPGDLNSNALGQAENLPNYYYLFLPTANGDPEFIIAFNHGSTGTNQGDELMRDMAGRSLEFSQCWVTPRFAIADRYQSTVTGDFCDSLKQIIPNAGGRTAPNSALNPDSYADRDFRMKASIMWDYEFCKGIYNKQETGWVPFIYKTWATKVTIDGEEYTSYETDRCLTGYVFRKFIRNYADGERSEGDFNWPVIRLADVYLMYAEAVCLGNIAAEKSYAIEQVNKVRRRGNLPALAADKTATQDAFFAAIDQERSVELLGEGQRPYDLRRWRRIEKAFCPPFDPDGYAIRDTWGNLATGYSSNGILFQNDVNLSYERCYIFQIPESERIKNPNLTQNKPFL